MKISEFFFFIAPKQLQFEIILLSSYCDWSVLQYYTIATTYRTSLGVLGWVLGLAKSSLKELYFYHICRHFTVTVLSLSYTLMRCMPLQVNTIRNQKKEK